MRVVLNCDQGYNIGVQGSMKKQTPVARIDHLDCQE